jgi:hypothetical protein
MSLKTISRAKITALEAIAGDTSAVEQLRTRATALREVFEKLQTEHSNLESAAALLDALQQFQRLGFLYHAKASAEPLQP